MEFQKLLIKTAYWLVAISILVMIGLTIFSQHLIKKQANNTASETVTNSESLNQDAPGEDAAAKKDTDESTDFEDIEKSYSGEFFQTE
ncbi:hypothetical protein ACFL6W_04305 [Thermodesulfobacteriota bacterium]